jgi:hypothetical protein
MLFVMPEQAEEASQMLQQKYNPPRRSPGNLAGNTASLRLYCGNMGNKAWRKFPIRRHP